MVLVSDPAHDARPTCTFSYTILHKLSYLKQFFVDFTKILRWERGILIFHKVASNKLSNLQKFWSMKKAHAMKIVFSFSGRYCRYNDAVPAP
jgi:hypothetical protein